MINRSLLLSLLAVTSLWCVNPAHASLFSRFRTTANRLSSVFRSPGTIIAASTLAGGVAAVSAEEEQPVQGKETKRWIPILFPYGKYFSPVGPKGALGDVYPEAVVCITPSKLGGAARATIFGKIMNDTELQLLQELQKQQPMVQIGQSQMHLDNPMQKIEGLPIKSLWIRIRENGNALVPSRSKVPKIVSQNPYWQGLNSYYPGIAYSMTHDASASFPFQPFGQQCNTPVSDEVFARAEKLESMRATLNHDTNVFMREDVDPEKLKNYGIFLRCNKNKTMCVAGTTVE